MLSPGWKSPLDRKMATGLPKRQSEPAHAHVCRRDTHGAQYAGGEELGEGGDERKRKKKKMKSNACAATGGMGGRLKRRAGERGGGKGEGQREQAELTGRMTFWKAKKIAYTARKSGHCPGSRGDSPGACQRVVTDCIQVTHSPAEGGHSCCVYQVREECAARTSTPAGMRHG